MFGVSWTPRGRGPRALACVDMCGGVMLARSFVPPRLCRECAYSVRAACGRACGVLGATPVALRAGTYTKSTIHLLECGCLVGHMDLVARLCGSVSLCVWVYSAFGKSRKVAWRCTASHPLEFLPGGREPRTHTPFYWLRHHDGTGM